MLDNKDLKILAAVDHDARRPYTRLSKDLHINKEIIRYRLGQLEQTNVIRGYYTLINTQRIGFDMYRIYLDLIDARTEVVSKIIKALDKLGAGYIFTIDGKWQIGAFFWEQHQTLHTFAEKVRKLRYAFSEYIDSYEATLLTNFNHYYRSYLPGGSVEFVFFERTNTVKLSKEDKQLLTYLADHGKAMSTEVGRALEIPQRTAYARMKALEKKGVICGYRADIDINQIGRENYYLEVYVREHKDVKRLEMFARTSKECTYTVIPFPGADIEIELEVENRSALLEFIEKLYEKFPGIRKIRHQSTLQYHKIQYLPLLSE